MIKKPLNTRLLLSPFSRIGRAVVFAFCWSSLWFAAALHAATTGTSGNFTYSDSGTAITITGYSSSAIGPAVIPSTINGKAVVAIGANAFSDRTKMTGVTIPASVLSIGDNAFASCTGLTTVTIPASVTSLGTSVFGGCFALTTLSVDAANPGYSSLNGVLFDKLKSTLVEYPSGKTGAYTIPSGVTTVGSYAFYNCTGLTSVAFPSGVTSIGSYAFDYCSGLTAVTIPASVTAIGSYAFDGCSNLKSVKIPPCVTSIAGFNFSSFFTGSGINLTISGTGSSIGSAAFYNSSGLASVSIVQGVTTIANRAFENCTGLKSVTIPDSVTSIGDNAFRYCTDLSSVSVDSANQSYSSLDGVLFDKSKTVLLLCPAGKTGTFAIPSGVKSIAMQAFAFCSKLTDVTIPEGVTAIGDYAFCYCSGLTGVTIPSGVTVIGTQIFMQCSGLTSVSLPAGVTSIGMFAFAFCTSLQDVIIPSSVTDIKDLAFFGCSILTGAEFMGKAPKMGATVFDNAGGGFTVKYHGTSAGFTSPTWKGYAAVDLDPAAPRIATATLPLPSGNTGIPYSLALQATGGVAPLTWSLLLGSLPPGLSLGSDGLISGTPMVATTGSFTIRVSGSNGLYATVDCLLTVNSPFTTWQGSRFDAAEIAAGTAAADADSDNDGLPNLLEYAFSSDPKTPGTSPATVDVGAGHLALSFPCDASRTDVTFTVQSSSTLAGGSWTDIARSIGGAPAVPVGSLSTVSDSGTGLRTVTVTDASPLSAGGSRFLRVRVTSP